MKIRTLAIIIILVLAVLIIIGGCATTPKPQEEREVFFQSVSSGDYAEVKRLIEEGANVNAQANDGVTALIFASGFGHTDIARLLIEAGAK
ncbi:hypothetical protein ES705_18682 [subsurface metagenome]